ncbi:MAG: fibronectin type III domain-containing protein [Muribaculaceae bacterium]|nr:fibronectin type III domain-containing protein [Muribaculaceae bacterium]
MKKLIYSLVGCATLLAVGTAQGGEILTQALNTLGGVSAQSNAGHNENAYLRLGSPTDVYAKFNASTGFVDLSFTAPGTAWWSDDYEYITEEEKATTRFSVRVFRNEGYYFNEQEAEIVKEFTDVNWLDDLAFTDESQLAHGKRYCYYVAGYLFDKKGDSDFATVEVGYKIDPAGEFEVKAAEGAALKAYISFTAPTTCNDGAYTLSETDVIPSIVLTRRDNDDWSAENVKIKTFENVKPGESLSYVDEDEALESGTTYQYRLRLNYDGQEVQPYENSATVFIGADLPAAPTALGVELLPDGNVKVSWTAPAEGVNGAWFDPEQVTYKIERGSGSSAWNVTWEEIANKLTSTEFIDEGITEEGSYYYRVTSQLNGKDSEYATSVNAVVAGPPSPFPFDESWPDGKAKHSTWVLSTGWMGYGKNSISYYDASGEHTTIVVPPADNDGGQMVYTPGYSGVVGAASALTTGRISLKDAVNPVLRFMYFDLDPEASDNTLKVYVSADGGDYKELEGFDFAALPHDNSWTTVMFSLADYVDEAEYIQVRFEVTLGEREGDTVIDCVEIRDARQVDMAVTAVKAPVKFYPGAKMNVTVNLENYGDYDSEPFALMLSIGDEELGYAEGEGLKSNGKTTLNVPVQIPESAKGGENEIKVEVIGGFDADESNNIGTMPVEVVALPAASNLSYDSDLQIFTWDAAAQLPFYDGAITHLEDFAAYDDCTNKSFGEWTVVDKDNDLTYTLPGVADDYPNQGRATGGFVFTPSAYGSSWDAPVEGGKCFVFPGCKWYANDWLISPELDGSEQTISFKILTTDGSYISEEYDFCISSTDAATESFTVLKHENLTSYVKWEDREFTVPAGTKYFAINYKQYYGDLLAFCDFKYITGSGMLSEPTEHLGYNLYREDVKVNDEPIVGTQYKFADGAASSGLYFVKTAYNNAESAPTDPVDVIISGVSSATVDPALISVKDSELVLNSKNRYDVVTLGGSIVASGTGSVNLSLAGGIYIVTVDGEVFKVVVK